MRGGVPRPTAHPSLLARAKTLAEPVLIVTVKATRCFVRLPLQYRVPRSVPPRPAGVEERESQYHDGQDVDHDPEPQALVPCEFVKHLWLHYIVGTALKKRPNRGKGPVCRSAECGRMDMLFAAKWCFLTSC